MNALKFIYFKDDPFFVGRLEEYPDYMTQGRTLRELQENLEDIYHDIKSGLVI